MTTPFLTAKPLRSVGIAILLTILFGPIGLFYASISGALIMILTPIAVFLLLVFGVSQNNAELTNLSAGLLALFALTYWLLGIIWAVISVKSYNKKVEYENNRQFELWESRHKEDQNQIVINVSQDSLKVNASERGTMESSRPSLREWAKSNPGKSINDYYAKFGR